MNVSVQDRVLIHLLENNSQADKYLVDIAMTRPGIAASCALHPPNVSRTMRNMFKQNLVSEHTRSIKGDDRRQKTWQLTEEGLNKAKNRQVALSETKVLVRNQEGDLLEVEASKVSQKLDTEMTLLQILMHAQHEGVLTYGDIRFGKITKEQNEKSTKPGRIKALTGAHATYDTQPPKTRSVRGRSSEISLLKNWFENRKSCMVIHGIAGIGKSTLVSHWLDNEIIENPNLSVCWYPCQPWDTALGLATSLLHRFGIDEKHDPYDLIETLPLAPGESLNVDLWRRRLLAYLTDAHTIRERFKDESGGPPPYWLIVLDDVHHIEKDASNLLGAILQLSKVSPLRVVMISRSRPSVYDRRDVHTRDFVEELALKGLNLEEIEHWLKELKQDSEVEAKTIHEKTGGHPLALELLELYGNSVHVDWLQFLDDEILIKLPENEKLLLSNLSKSNRPVKWQDLAKESNWSGNPPKELIDYGLLVELEDGMWLHEALKERLLREIN